MIAFSCTHCGGKLRIKDQFAGKRGKCPLCKQVFLVPAADTDETIAPPPAIDGSLSSLASAGISGGVTLDHQSRDDSPVAAGKKQRRALRDIVERNANGKQRYIIEDEIARGGMGAVLRAVDCDIRREVAVKYMLKTDANASQKTRFIEEAQITGQLEHPNIVPIHELGVDAEKRIFFSMKMVKGRSLAQIIKSLSGEPPASTGGEEYTLNRLLTIFDKICNALAYAHSRGVVHRDLKPANIMVGDFGEVYVMDWGLAKVLNKADTAITPANPFDVSMPLPAVPVPSGSASGSQKVVTSREGDADLTQDGAVLGTPVYMPPEQASGELKEIDERSDIYSLGAILYELLTLQPPIDKAGGFLAILMRVGLGEIAPPAEKAPERARSGKIPPELSAVAMKALAKEKAKRYQSITELQRDIQLFQEGRSVSAKQDSLREMAVKFIKRNKGVSAAVGILMPLLFIVLLYSAISNYQARAATAKAYQDYQEQVKKSVPAFVKAAQLAAEQRLYDDAMKQVDVALASDPDYAAARLLKAQLLIVRQDFAAAARELERYIEARPKDAPAGRLLALCRDAQPDDMDSLMTIAGVFVEQRAHSLVDGLLRKYGKNSNEARQFLLKMYRARIEKAWPGKGRYLTMDTAGLYLNFRQFRELTDLSPLKGIPLVRLECFETSVADLSPLKGMPLKSLNCFRTGVADLSPLAGTPLTALNCSETRVSDLSPLKGMPLSSLDCRHTQVADLSPLQGMPLTTLHCGATEVMDLSPLKGMSLTTLYIYRTKITDLSPLAGMPLIRLEVNENRAISDLSPLTEIPLTHLNCSRTGVVDLSPLKGMPLTSLIFYESFVTDLTPLKGMKLSFVSFSPRRVTKGIEVIRNMKSLTKIGIQYVAHFTAADFWKRYDAGEFKKK